MDILDVLESRGYIEQITDEENLRELFKKEKCVPFYIGFDPTADSLHVGHFVSMMVASYMQKAGHRPIILVGGGTVTIGDPSGKTDMRRMMSREEINHNVECCKKQLEKFVSFEGENAAIVVNNADWLLDLKYVEFMRNIGSLFSVNKMLAADCYKNRMETGLTFFEMGYMLMQSYDFLHLYNKYGCKLEMGGNDQWSNIIGGVNLIRKVGHDDSFGLTFKLLTTKEGKKMGKTEKGALWLDPEKTSPYEFYQYWRNIDDSEVENVMKMLTFLPVEEIEKLTHVEGEKINEAKKVAAYEITKLVHGEENAKKAQEAAKALFEGKGNTENMPTVEVEEDSSILDAIITAGFASSKGQAKTLIAQGGITLNDEKVSDIGLKLSKDLLEKEVILRKGKKSYCKLQMK
jgi:tyrosyl-tRNA synthetase